MLDGYYDDYYVDRQVSSYPSSWTKNNTKTLTGITPSRLDTNTPVNWQEVEEFPVDIYYSFVQNVYNKYQSHLKCCLDCKGKGTEKSKSKEAITAWLMDSGASIHFTSNKSDFVSYQDFTNKNCPFSQTATNVVPINGFGTVFVKVISHSKETGLEIHRLYPVLYLESLHMRLMSTGQLLSSGMSISGTEKVLRFYDLPDKIYRF